MTTSRSSGSKHGPVASVPEPVLLTVTEASRLLRISRNLCYELIAQDRLPYLRLGRRILVPRHGLEQWIARESGCPASAPRMLSFRTLSH